MIGAGGGFANVSYFPYPAIYFDETNTTGRTLDSATINPSENTMIIFAAGQSRLTNYPGTTQIVPLNATKVLQLNPYDSNVYQMQDGVLGVAGGGGNYLTRLGDALIGSAVCQRVIFIPMAISGTSTADWVDPDFLNRIEVCCRKARAYNWHLPSANLHQCIIWENGQTDVAEGVTSEQYQQNIKTIQKAFKGSGFDYPFFIAQSTMDVNVTNATIRAAQAACVNTAENRYAGPDLDTLTGTSNLQDGTHFTTTGLTNAANKWRDALNVVF